MVESIRCRSFDLIGRTVRAGRWRSCGGVLLCRIDLERFFTRERERVKEGLHGGLSEAPLALMGPGLVELAHPEVEVGLEVVDRGVDLLAEGDAVELVEHGLVEALDDAVGLRAPGLGSGVVDVLDRQIELVFVAVMRSAKFGSAIGEHALQGNVVLLVERDHAVVEQVGGGERGLAIVQLGEADFGVGVDEGLLVDAPDALERPDVEGVLTRRSIPGIRRRIRHGPPCRPWPSRGRRPALRSGSGRPEPSWASSALSRCFMSAGRGAARPSARQRAKPISLAWRVRSTLAFGHEAGWSIAIATTAASISGSTRFFKIGLRRDIS